jgi:predicted small metal-binding protein
MAATAAPAERKYIDCSEYPSDNACTVKISGKEDEVLNVAVQHAVATHGHEDTPEFREELRGMLKTE